MSDAPETCTGSWVRVSVPNSGTCAIGIRPVLYRWRWRRRTSPVLADNDAASQRTDQRSWRHYTSPALRLNNLNSACANRPSPTATQLAIDDPEFIDPSKLRTMTHVCDHSVTSTTTLQWNCNTDTVIAKMFFLSLHRNINLQQCT